MIVKRYHTANFTTIGNALFEDERLAADEVGILAYLLSRPHDWEVRRPALMRRWKIGREALKRVIESWMRAGWCRAEKRRLPNGTFEIMYEIRDEPGPSLTADEVRRALSLVSSEAASEESEAISAVGSLPDTTSPPTGEPPLAEPHAARPQVVDSKEQNTDSPKKDSTQKNEREANREHARKAKGLSAFEARWPTAAADNRARTAAAWNALPESEEDAAIVGVAGFLENLKRLGRKHIPAGWKYLEGMSWKLLDAAKPPAEAATQHFPDGSPEAKGVTVAYALVGKLSYFHAVVKSSQGGIWYRGPVDERLRMLATAPVRDQWVELDYRQAKAWDEAIDPYVALQTRTHLKQGSMAPWPWPPSVDGKIYTQDSTGPPDRVEGTLATEEDMDAFARG